MKATSRSFQYIYKCFALYILMVIITLPGTHLLANEEAPVARYKTSVHHNQLKQAIEETEKRILNHYKHSSDNTHRSQLFDHALDIRIELLPSASMNYHLTGFVPESANSKALILINSNWLEYGISDEALIRLILEGTGAAIATRKEGKLITDGNWLANELSSIYRDESTFSKKADAILLNGIRTEVYFQ
jgi:hypothetical protein